MVSTLLDAGRHAVGLYRFSYWLEHRLGRPGKWLAYLVYRLNITLTGADIPPTATIGKGFFIPHPTGIVVGRATVIGDDAKVMSGVVIGSRGAHRTWSDDLYPRIGHRVFIGANSVVVGPITIGDDVMIGAGVVVSESVAASSVVHAAKPAIEPRTAGRPAAADADGLRVNAK